MKRRGMWAAVVTLGAVLALVASQSRAQDRGALSTGFTYQGRLQKDGQLIDGACDLQFSLWDALAGGNQVGATQSRTDVPIAEGLFTVADLDFGGGAFSGEARWLEVAVQCSGETSFTVLRPRQALTAAPYASYAAQVGAHSHLGQTWTGSDNPLTLEGSFGAAPLVLNNSSGDGLRVDSAGDDGLQVTSAGGDGVYVGSAGEHGLLVYSANNVGVYVVSAGNDGVYVGSAGSPSAATSSTLHNGFEVAGAEGRGLYVGRADLDGLRVDSAGQHGVWVTSAGGDGVFVGSAGGNGVAVSSADQHGVGVFSAVHDGVYAHTTQANQEWGFYTPDKIYAGSALTSGGPSMIVAQNGDGAPLEPGTVVVVSGLGAPFAESDFPAPLVQRAGAGHGAVMGVVYARFVAEEKVEEVEHDGQVEQRTSQHSRTGEGPIAPGDYLLVVALGPAQVKAVALGGEIRSGDLLVLAGEGAAARMVSGSAYLPGSMVGTAMEGLEAARGSGLLWVLVQPR
jgi:hypothetical protein